MSTDSSIKHLLLQLKLPEKEAKVFISLVRLETTVTSIARDSGVTRTYIYDLLQSLLKKGLASEVEVNSIKTYEAVDHAGLLAFVTREQKELKTIEKQLTQLASEFHALEVGRQQRTKVRFFNGVEGVKNIYAEIRHDLERQIEPGEFITIFSPENLERVIPGFQYLNYPNMSGRDIVAEDRMIDVYRTQMNSNKNKISFKIWPQTHGLFPTDSIAWKNKIAYIDLAGFPSGIIIENEAIVQTFTMWFNVMWATL